MFDFFSRLKLAFHEGMKELSGVVKIIEKRFFWDIWVVVYFRVLNSANFVNILSEKKEQQVPEN